MEKVHIYGLKDPRDGNFYYVGRSTNLKQRFRAHLKDKTTNLQKAKWIDGLRDLGLMPELVVLQEVEEDNGSRAEAHWIRRGFNIGWPLVNGSGGGSEPDEDCLLPFIKPDLLKVFYSLSEQENG